MNYIDLFKKGGIHIKKENRGKFTEYCGGKVTEECIQRGKNSSNPVIRKRATFAKNVRGWARKGAEGFLTVAFNPAFDMDTQLEDYRYSIPSLLGRETASKLAAPVADDLDARYDRLQLRTSKTSSSITSNNFTQALTQAYRNIGIKDENLIKILVGKDALETGWGKSVIGQNNFGNITTGSNWTGLYVEHHNRRNGQTYKFRSYASPEEYARDSWGLLSNRYGIKEGDTTEVVRLKLNRGGYAEEGYGDGFSRICRLLGAA